MNRALCNIVLAALFLSLAVCSAADVSSCLGSDLFVVVSGKSVTFAEAQNECEVRNAALARVQSAGELAFVTNLVAAGARVWIGIDARARIGNRSPGTTDFIFTDGITGGESFFRVNVGTFPWNLNEPNNFDDNEACVEIRADGFFNDISCDQNLLDFACRVVDSPACIPTKTPTASPSTKPTISPTSNPTISPSAKPSTSPTFSPTFSPVSPSSSPTFAPTESPVTFVPSVSPTKTPTSAPSETPPRQCLTEKLGINRAFEF